MTPSPYNIEDADPFVYAKRRRMSPLSPTIPPAAMNPSGSSQGFSPDDPGDDPSWWRPQLDPAANRITSLSSSGPAGTGQSAQPQADLKTGDVSAGAGKVLNGAAKKMPPPGMPAPTDDPGAAGMSPAPQAKQLPPGVTPEMQVLQERQKQLVAHPPQQIGNRPQDIDPTTGKEKLGAKAASWGQRLALALLSATKLAPYAQQIVRPEWTQQMAANEAEQKGIQGELGNQEKIENIGYLGESREAVAEQRKAQAANYAAENQRKIESDKANEQIKADADFTKTLPKEATAIDASSPDIPALQAQGWHVQDDPRDHREGVSRMKVAIPPAFITVTPDNQEILVGRKTGERVPWSEYKSSLAEHEKAQREIQKANVTAQNKPPSAEANEMAYEGALGKLRAEGLLAPGSLMDAKQVFSAIQRSKTLTDAEKNAAIGHLGAKTTPAAQGTQATIRVEGMQQSRGVSMLDTKYGNRPTEVNMDEINRANREEPGRYIPSGTGVTALGNEAKFQDLQQATQRVRDALGQIPEFSAADKTKIAMAMRSADPASSISNLLNNAASGFTTPQQQEYLIALHSMYENAMVMRTILGAGQGSDQLRAAVQATIPGPQTPNKAYAAKQLDLFDQTLSRLHRGIPNVQLRNDGPAPPAGGPSHGATKPTGNIMDRWGYKPADQ